MKLRKCVAEAVRTFDLFSSTQLLRYKQDEDYKTVSGGLTSILVVAIFTILFAGNAIATLEKTSITWEMTKQNYFDPLPSNLSINHDSKSMFAVGILGINLNDPNFRYFEIDLIEIQAVNDIFNEVGRISLQPCTVDHFSQTQTLRQQFTDLNMSTKVCPPLNYSFELKGKMIANNLRNFEIRIYECNASLLSTRPCINQTVIDNMINTVGSVSAILFYVNPLINPGDINYLDYYLDDTNFISFTKFQGAYTMVYVEDYVIETDQSLLPLSQIHTDKGIRVPQLSRLNPMDVYAGIYVSYYFQKASSQTTYKRSFNKIDQLFSYVGGLIGTILGFMLFMNHFTSMSFELDIAHKFFKFKDDDPNEFKNFNLVSYFGYLFYKAGSYCGFCKGWASMKKKEISKEEVAKQLDIELMLKRFNYLQRAVQYLLKQQKIQMNEFISLETLQAIKYRRRKYKKQKQKQVKDDENNQESNESDSDSDRNSESQRKDEYNREQVKLSIQIQKKYSNVSLQNIQNESYNNYQYFQSINESKNEIGLQMQTIEKQLKESRSKQTDIKAIQNLINVVPKYRKRRKLQSQQDKSDSMHFEQQLPFK